MGSALRETRALNVIQEFRLLTPCLGLLSLCLPFPKYCYNDVCYMNETEEEE